MMRRVAWGSFFLFFTNGFVADFVRRRMCLHKHTHTHTHTLSHTQNTHTHTITHTQTHTHTHAHTHARAPFRKYMSRVLTGP